MARKASLRLQRAGTVINLTAKKQETEIGQALAEVVQRLLEEFKLELHHAASWPLADIVDKLKGEFPDVPFGTLHRGTSIRPDAGILSIVGRDGQKHPILIGEVKNQGTNDLRATEGLSKQAKGNAIERLGKNVIGIRTAFLSENIVPFVCFGYGCDFADDSSILDRVVTIAMFGPLNEVCLVNLGDAGVFNRGSFYFREEPWTVGEMEAIMYDVASRAIHYYFAKYGKDGFEEAAPA
jgi:type II restriction enzyme